MAKSNIDKLMELKQLYEQGILTKEEMEVEKKKILGQPNSDDTKSEVGKTVDNNASVKEHVNTRNNEAVNKNKLDDRKRKNHSFFQKHKKIVIVVTIIAVICIIIFSIKGNSEVAQAPVQDSDSIEEIQPEASMVNEYYEKMNKRIADFYKEQQKKGGLSLERFLRNDDIKNLILDKYNANYYNAVMELMKNGYVGNVELTSDGIYKGHANVYQRITGVDPYDDWAVDFSYNPNSNQLELKATYFGIPLKNDGSIDNEGIEKELERLRAESQEKKQKELQEIESQAISFENIIDAYKNNVNGRADDMYYKQEKIYQFYLKKIRKSSSDYEYVMEGSGASHGDLADFLVYTDDSRLANLNYPVKLCFRGALVSIGRPEYGDWYIYHFVCTEALTYRY